MAKKDKKSGITKITAAEVELLLTRKNLGTVIIVKTKTGIYLVK